MNNWFRSAVQEALFLGDKRLRADPAAVERVCRVLAVMLLRSAADPSEAERLRSSIAKALRALKTVKDEGRFPGKGVGHAVVSQIGWAQSHPTYGLAKGMDAAAVEAQRRAAVDLLGEAMCSVMHPTGG